MDWFLYDKDLRHERVKGLQTTPNSSHINKSTAKQNPNSLQVIITFLKEIIYFSRLFRS